MCGRFLIYALGRDVAELFGLPDVPSFPPRYNVAPTQTVPVVRQTPEGRAAANMRWGLIPSWAKDPSIGNRSINARCETAATKPSFRSAFKHRRCLVPANGFYEWKAARPRKQPFVVRPKSEGLFAFAGLWEGWRDGDGDSLETFTILTTAANDLLRPCHDRMPVIVAREDFDTWLDTARADTDVARLFEPFPAANLSVTPVSTWVNDARHEGARCLDPPDGEPRTE
jgi:putative SOS response-associated peptidase YedK